MATGDKLNQGVSNSILCVGLSDVALKHAAAICLLSAHTRSEELLFINDFRSRSEFCSVLLVVSLVVSLMVEQVEVKLEQFHRQS